ncbi:hypothetical protein LTS10_003674 [Elasticomyces elasticus]|nr:hypothetical protein LTS10_003674 [Elasticomyces elasticus]
MAAPPNDDAHGKVDLSIENLRSQYQQSTLSPAEVVNVVYSRVSAYHDKAVWITLIPQDDALERANQLSTQYPESVGRPALYGIPFSVKDSIHVAAMPTTLACPSYAYTATATAFVVQRILDAGGILIGKTNLDQFATGLNGTRSPYGMPRSVHDPDYISGGSSSGSVVSVAADLVSFTVATDTAGSTRVPASLNGMVGLKPTLGTISTVGLVPACKTADCVTIIARTIDTTLAALDVMQAYDEDDVYAREVPPMPTPWDKSSPALRYGLPPQDLVDTSLSPQYLDLFNRFLTALRSTKMQLSSTMHYEPFAEANAMLYGSSIVSQRIVAFKDYLDLHGFNEMHPVVAQIFRDSAGFDAVRAYEDIFSLAKHKRNAHKQFRGGPGGEYENEGIDVLIVPSTSTHPTVDEMLADPLALNKRLGTFTHFVNLLDLCAVSVPVKATWASRNEKQIPFGVTLIGMPGRDRDLLELGRRMMEMEM